MKDSKSGSESWYRYHPVIIDCLYISCLLSSLRVEISPGPSKVSTVDTQVLGLNFPSSRGERRGVVGERVFDYPLEGSPRPRGRVPRRTDIKSHFPPV